MVLAITNVRILDGLGGNRPKGTVLIHDAQIAVSGPAAKTLSCLFRERWRKAAGEELPHVPDVPTDPWPPSLAPVARDAEGAGITRGGR